MKLRLLCLFLFPFLFIKAQQKTIDSLYRIINTTKNDTLQLRALDKLGALLLSGPEWEKCVQQTYVIALKRSAETEGKLKIDYLRYLVSAYANMASKFEQSSRKDSATLFFNKALSLAEEINYPMGKVLSLNGLGLQLLNDGDGSHSLDYFKRAVVIMKESGDEGGMGAVLNNIGSIYSNFGDIPKTLDYYHQALDIEEKNHNKYGQSYLLNNIAGIYEDQGEQQKALEYYHKSLALKKELNIIEGVPEVLDNMAKIYFKLGDQKKTQEYEEEAIKLHLQLGNKRGLANTYNNIGTRYKGKGDFEKALEYYNRSLMLNEEIKRKSGIAKTLVNVGSIYLEKNNIGKAMEMGTKAMALSKEGTFPDQVMACASLLRKVYTKQNKYKEALEMYELYIKMRDSVDNKKSRELSLKKQFQYEYEKKATADSLKAAEQKEIGDARLAESQAKLQQAATQRYALFGGLALVLVFTGFMYNRVKITQQQKKIIERQKDIVEAKQKEVMDSIKYARRIQNALMPTEKYMERILTTKPEKETSQYKDAKNR